MKNFLLLSGSHEPEIQYQTNLRTREHDLEKLAEKKEFEKKQKKEKLKEL